MSTKPKAVPLDHDLGIQPVARVDFVSPLSLPGPGANPLQAIKSVVTGLLPEGHAYTLARVRDGIAVSHPGRPTRVVCWAAVQSYDPLDH